METGRRFRDTVLALGGGKSPLEVRLNSMLFASCCNGRDLQAT